MTVAAYRAHTRPGVIMHASTSVVLAAPVAAQSVKGVGLLLHFPGPGSGHNRPREPTG